MKVTVVKIVTPVDAITKQKDINFTRREEVAVLFFDPWNHPGSSEWNNMITKLNRHMADIMNQNNDLICVSFDLIYTINGIGHFRDHTITLIDELRNYHYADAATYEGIMSKYCQGHKIIYDKYKACKNSKIRAVRLVDATRKKHSFRVVGHKY